MLHEFFKNDLQKDFILHLIANTPLPIYDTISYGDYIIKDKLYTMQNHIIKCTKTGIFQLDKNDEVIPTTGEPNRKQIRANYTYVSDYVFGEYLNNYTEYLVCNSSIYDYQTHQYLGRYLRALKDLTNINIMLMYNCFSYNLIDNIEILQYSEDSKHYFRETSNKFYKEILIPIKFNKKYMLGIDCSSEVKLLPILYSNRGVLKDTETFKYMGDEYKNIFKVTNLNKTSFYNPYTFEIDTSILTEELESKLYDLLKYLYVLILIPKSNNSSLVLLEGEYPVRRIEYLPVIPQDVNVRIVDKICNSSPALLQFNDNIQYAYNDKIIQYLLQNVITGYEEIEGNIEYIQEMLRKWLPKELPRFSIDSEGNLIQKGGEFISQFYIGETQNEKDNLNVNSLWYKPQYKIDSDDYLKANLDSTNINYKGFAKDLWSNKLRVILYYMYMNNAKTDKTDINGFIDSDIERYLKSIYVEE